MKHYLLTILLAFCALAGANAESITKTYFFRGSQSGNTYQGYFCEEGKPNAHYTCFPDPWTVGSTSSIHATLVNGITINFASSNNQIGVYQGTALTVGGDVTVTIGGGTNNYYIRHVTLYYVNGSTSIDETNWGTDVESTHTFSKTISGGSFNKIVITYSTEDIYLINESTTTISGVNNKYEFAGSAIEPEPVVVCNGRTLTRGTHYDVNYSNNQTPGTASLTVTGKSPFRGTISRNYTIVDNAMVPMEWTAGMTVNVTADYTTWTNISVTGTGNVTLVIADGVTLTASHGITIADGATLIVNGPGTLTVQRESVNSSANGNDCIVGNVVVNGGTVNVTGGNCGAGARAIYDPGTDGENGGNGGTGIKGSLTVTGGTVTITGGRGGNGGSGSETNGNGGAGGAGISGSLTLTGGTVTITGGDGGMGGSGSNNMGTAILNGLGGAGGTGISGSLTVTGGTVTSSGGKGIRSIADFIFGSGSVTGKALGGTVTCAVAGYVIQESNDNSTWSNLASGSTSTKGYVKVVQTIPLTLYDNADNTSAITAAAADDKLYTVTLDGRTLYKDGYWNTLCLPFDVIIAGSVLDGDGVDVRSLTGSSFDSSTGALTLTFYDPEEVIDDGPGTIVVVNPISDDPPVSGPITTIEAGKPYIIRWGTPENHPSTNLTNPVFNGVTIKSGTTGPTPTETDYVDFIGSYAPEHLTAGDKSTLYLGSNNTLYYPADGSSVTLNAFRAYFHVDLGDSQLTAVKMNFEEEGQTSSLRPLTISPEGERTEAFPREGLDGVWFDLSGRKLSGKPTTKGIYIVNGRKVVIK